MTRSLHFLSGSIVALACVAGATTAAAQQNQEPRPERPYRGLFGGDARAMEQSLSVSGSAGGGWDGQVLLDAATDPTFGGTAGNSASTAYGQLGAGLSYSLSRSRASFGASANTSSRYLPSLANKYTSTHGGSIGTSLELFRGLRVNGGHSATFQPYQTLNLLPALNPGTIGEAPVVELTFGVRRATYIVQNTSAGVSQTFGRRLTVSADYSLTRANSQGGNAGRRSETSGARILIPMTRGLGLRLGYGLLETDLRNAGDLNQVRQHSIDAGVDFTRDLSLTRRTSLTLTTGSGAIRSGNDSLQYRVTGSATLRREIGRTWNAVLSYNRGLGFIEQIREPLFSDAANLSITGLLTRRLQFHSQLGGTLGDVGLSGQGNYRSYSGVAGVNTAITRHLAVTADYLYLHYQFDTLAGLLPPGFASDMNRHGMRVSLSVWAPVFQRVRRPDASR